MTHVWFCYLCGHEHRLDLPQAAPPARDPGLLWPLLRDLLLGGLAFTGLVAGMLWLVTR